MECYVEDGYIICGKCPNRFVCEQYLDEEAEDEEGE